MRQKKILFSPPKNTKNLIEEKIRRYKEKRNADPNQYGFRSMLEVVLDNWQVFRSMAGWKSPTGAIKHYKDNPEDFLADLTELTAVNALAERRTEPAEDTKEQTHQTSLAIDNIKTLASGGYTAEVIQEMVPDFIDGSGWSLESIRKIAEGEMGMIAAWAKDYGRGL